MTYFNNLGQARVGWRIPSGAVTPSTLWNSVYAVYNADAVGSSSLNTSLFAAYNGESNTNDSKGVNNGTPQGGLTYTAGKIGNAFQFNGTNALVSLPNTSGQFNFDGDFTVSVWFRSSNLSASRYFMNNDQDNGTTWGYGWSFFYSGSLGFTLQLSNGSATNRVSFQSGYAANTWYHVVAVRKMGQKHKIYVNGVDTPAGQYGDVNTPAGYIANQKMELAGISRLNLFALCDLDGVNMWNRALTASEITELYNSGNGAQYITDNFYKPTTNDALLVKNGTPQGGLTYGVGKVGTAFTFNGTNAQIDFTANTMDIGDTFSISYWGYYVNNSSNGQCVLSNYYETGGKWGFFIYTSNGIHYFNRFNGTTQYSLQSTVIPINTWKHFVFTRKANSTKIYVDGVLVASDTNNIVTAYNVLCKPRIGSREQTGLWRLASGTNIDALNIWNKELTSAEITELYNSGNGKQYPN